VHPGDTGARLAIQVLGLRLALADDARRRQELGFSCTDAGIVEGVCS
jgi:hypothetical protein